MCMDCGCFEPEDSHGDPRHITLQMLMDAAEASGIDVDAAIRNINDTRDMAYAQILEGEKKKLVKPIIKPKETEPNESEPKQKSKVKLSIHSIKRKLANNQNIV